MAESEGFETSQGEPDVCMAKYKFNNSIKRLAIAAFTDHYYSQTT